MSWHSSTPENTSGAKVTGIEERRTTMISFEEFKSEALKRCRSEEETKRVSEEIELFSVRGWEKYVLLVVNIINGLQECGFEFHEMAGSALDSFAIWLLTTDRKKKEGFLKNERKKWILFNDTLRLSICIHERFVENHPEFTEQFNSILETNLKEFGLVCSKHMVKGRNPLQTGSPDSKDTLIIVSNDKVLKSDEEWVLSETREVREGEIEILRKYLLLRVVMFGGL